MKQEPFPRSNAGIATVAPDAFTFDSAREYIRSHAKPVNQWRMGLEYELFGFERGSYRRINRARVQELLRALVMRDGIATLEEQHIIALQMPYGYITLEPGGQMEFSGFPQATLTETQRDLRSFLADLRELDAERAVFFVALGFDPLRNLDEQSWIRKRRYDIMRPYLRRQGGHAWDMMTRTASMQISLDYKSEEDLGRKYTLGNRLGPIVAAMCANSPYAGGALTGLKSTRYAVWLDTDPDRTGAAPAAFDQFFDFDATVRALMDVPTFFLERDGELVDTAGQRLTEMSDARADDFRSLLSMIFTEARIREYVEMRSADGGSPEYAHALVAFWKGLTYEGGALDAALEVAPRLDRAGFRALQIAVSRDALAARCEGIDVLTTARELVLIAQRGLRVVAPEEAHFLDPLAQNVVEDGVAPADILIRDCGSNVERAMGATTVA